jgi:hypothetical protein
MAWPLRNTSHHAEGRIHALAFQIGRGIYEMDQPSFTKVVGGLFASSHMLLLIKGMRQPSGA